MSKSSIGDVVAKTLAPADVPTAAIRGERTIENITSEILQLKTDAGNAIIGIGQRLNEAKELLPHGEWLPWLNDQIEFSERTAQEFMRIAREWSNPRTLADLGKSKALKLLLLPPAEREEFMEAHDVPNMSTRELEDAIRERDEARKRADEAEAAAETARESREKMEQDMKLLKEQSALDRETTDKLRDRVKELENAPKEFYKDEAAIQKAADEARRKTVEEWQQKMAKLTDDLQKAEEKLKTAKEKAAKQKADAEAGQAASAELEAAKKAEAEARAEAEQLRDALEKSKRDAAKAAVTGDADLAAFQLLYEAARTDVNKMHGILLKVRGRDEALAGKLTAALTAFAEKVKECAK